MRVENFFEQGIVDALKSSGVQELIPLEISLDELLSIFEGMNYRVIDPMAFSNVVRLFNHDGIGRYAVVRLSEDEETEVVVLLTKVDESGVESCPYVLDTSLDRFKSFLFS